MSEYFPPQYHNTGFHCPYCQVYAAQHWIGVMHWVAKAFKQVSINGKQVEASFCLHCGNPTFWWVEKIIYPPVHTSPPANSDLPDNVQTLFGLINLIADSLITQPKQVAEMYNQLPEEDRDRIRKRDGKTE